MNPLEKLLNFHRKGLKFDHVESIRLANPRREDKNCLMHAYDQPLTVQELPGFLERTAASTCPGCCDGMRLDGMSVHKWINFLTASDKVKSAFKNGFRLEDYSELSRLAKGAKSYQEWPDLQEYAKESISLLEEFKKEVGELDSSTLTDLIIERHPKELRRQALKGRLLQPGFRNWDGTGKELKQFRTEFTPGLLDLLEKFEEEAFNFQENLPGFMLVAVYNSYLSKPIGDGLAARALEKMYLLPIKGIRVFMIPEGMFPVYAELTHPDLVYKLENPLKEEQKEILVGLMNADPKRDFKQAVEISLNI